jgi:hypothetical protein
MWFQAYDKYENLCEYVVQMIGYYDTTDDLGMIHYCHTTYELRHEQISIYEYMPGGTLQQHLHGELFHIVQSKSR